MSSIEVETGDATARRRSNEVVDRVALRHAMADIVKNLEDLQHEAVFLRAKVSRHPSSSEELSLRVVALRQSVNATQTRFEEVVGTLPERQQTHSRVHDIRRALETLRNFLPQLED